MMHELNVCLSILDLLAVEAYRKQFCRVKMLWLEIGDLANIEPDALRFSFPIVASHSIAEQAVLEIITVEGRAWCDTCQNSVRIKNYFNPCPHCGQYDYQITHGKELKIVKMEVA